MEPEPKSEAKLHSTSLPTLKPTHNRIHSTSLPPLRTSASIPFSWELEPGIPLPCLTLALASSHTNPIKTLELPPRLVNEAIFTKTSSPTSVLEGPYCSLNLLRNNSEKTDKGLFGSWRKGREKSRSVGHEEGSFVFSSVFDNGISNGGVPRKKSQLSLSLAKSHFFLATMYGTLKHVIPRSTKCKKDAL